MMSATAGPLSRRGDSDLFGRLLRRSAARSHRSSQFAGINHRNPAVGGSAGDKANNARLQS